MTNAMPERTAIWKHDEANQLMPMVRKRADLRESLVGMMRGCKIYIPSRHCSIVNWNIFMHTWSSEEFRISLLRLLFFMVFVTVLCYVAEMLHTHYANQKLQPLDQHSALVGILSEHLLKKVYPGAPPAWKKMARWAGFLHDIGKIDASFQRFVKALETSEDGVHLGELDDQKDSLKFSWSKYPRHNEVSWLLMTTWFSKERATAWIGSTINFDVIRYAIYWHHAKPLRDVKSTELFATSQTIAAIDEMQWIQDSDVGNTLAHLMESICQWAVESTEAPLMPSYLEQNENIPGFKQSYSNTETIVPEKLADLLDKESVRSAVRACVVGADRIVSSLTAAELQDALESYRVLRIVPEGRIPVGRKPNNLDALLREIESMTERFALSPENKTQNDKQEAAATILSKYPLTVLQGPAGCGKTKVILQSLLKNPKKKTFVLVPRVAIGHGLFKEFIDDYHVTDGVELYTGDLKKSYDSVTKQVVDTPESKQLQGTLVITTIDQLCSLSLSHERINLFTEVMSSNVIVDEFHELFDIPGIVLLFLEFIRLRSYTYLKDDLTCAPRTHLVSATPNPYFLEQLQSIELNSDMPTLSQRVHAIETENTKPYTLTRAAYDIDGLHPFSRGVGLGEIAVSNTVRVAQESAVAAIARGVETLCFHSKYTPAHKGLVLDSVMKHFGKKAIAPPCVLFAGPIVQASLNISTRKLHTEAPTAENFLQRLGRVNRFKTFDHGEIVLYETTKNGKSQLVDSATLNNVYQTKRAQMWLNYCVANNWYKTFNLKEMYLAYNDFHAEGTTKIAYESDYLSILKASFMLFKKMVFDPTQFPKAASKSKVKTLSANSLRGRSYYILPRYYHVVGNRIAINQWLYGQGHLPEDMLTSDLNYLNFVDDSTLGIFLQYMRSPAPAVMQHHKELSSELRDFFKNGKKHIKFQHWKQRARNPAYPIVLTHEGSSTRSTHEQVYLKINNTWIGLAPLSLSPSINGSIITKEKL